MAFGLIIIGDEILSGKRSDQHFAHVVGLLRERGLQLAWAEIVGDDPARITALLRRTFASGDVVFSCGGIGATPDDHTRLCAANALDLPQAMHAHAREQIQLRIREMADEAGTACDLQSPENLYRLKMAEFPQGADSIPNPFNRVPGFAIREHYFVPGFPVMAWPMIAWVLDTHYKHLFHLQPQAERSLLVFDGMESQLTPLMEELETRYPLIKVFSLPSVGNERIARHIELGVKGDPAQVEEAFAAMQAGLQPFGVRIEPTGGEHGA
ncbi:MAG TPA: molybdopterin-binding protein [Burkholderiaceae bacterium]